MWEGVGGGGGRHKHKKATPSLLIQSMIFVKGGRSCWDASILKIKKIFNKYIIGYTNR